MKVIEQIQQPMIYPYWELHSGAKLTGSQTFVVPAIGTQLTYTLGVPIIRPFTTFRVTVRSRAVAAAATNWIVTLYKNTVATAFANGFNFGVAPAVANRTQLWVDLTGLIQTPVDFDRNDNWSIGFAGAAVTDPEVIIVMDAFGRFQDSTPST
jgi:hypothetical protein